MVQAQRTSSMRSALLLGNGFVVSSSAAIVSSSQTDPPSAQTSRTRTMHLHGSRFWSVSGSVWPIVENWKSRFRKRRLHDTSLDKEDFFSMDTDCLRSRPGFCRCGLNRDDSGRTVRPGCNKHMVRSVGKPTALHGGGGFAPARKTHRS